MASALKYILYALALVTLATGLNVLIGGASAIPGASGGAEASIDNELRFFSVFWLSYGAFCFWVARNLNKQADFIPFIAIVFFLGGVARLISTCLIGPPSNILISAMMLEFVMPILIFMIYRKLKTEN